MNKTENKNTVYKIIIIGITCVLVLLLFKWCNTKRTAKPTTQQKTASSSKAYDLDYSKKNEAFDIADIIPASRKEDVNPIIPKLEYKIQKKIHTLKADKSLSSQSLSEKEKLLNERVKQYLPIFDVRNIDGTVYYTNKKLVLDQENTNKFILTIERTSSKVTLRCSIKYQGAKLLDIKNILLESNAINGAYLVDISDDDYSVSQKNELIEEYTDVELDDNILALFEALQYDNNLKVTLMGFENNTSWEVSKGDIRSLKLTYEYYKILKKKYNQQ